MSTKMHRLQISLAKPQVQYLTERARREGTSMAELIRRLLQRESETAKKLTVDSIWEIVGIGKGPERLINDIAVSEAPDLYIAEQSDADSSYVRKKVGRSKRKNP